MFDVGCVGGGDWVVCFEYRCWEGVVGCIFRGVFGGLIFLMLGGEFSGRSMCGGWL